MLVLEMESHASFHLKGFPNLKKEVWNQII